MSKYDHNTEYLSGHEEVAKKLYLKYHPNSSWEPTTDHYETQPYWLAVASFLKTFHPELLPENGKSTSNQSLKKENQVSVSVTDNSYTFVSERKDVDFVRIVREAPAGTPFIVIEIKDRATGKSRYGNEPEILVLIHNNVVKNPRAKDLKVLGYKISDSGYWSNDPASVPHLYSYVGRWVYEDKVNTFRNEIAKVKKALNSKDTVTKVELL